MSLGETAGCITFEGATSNGNQNRLCTLDPLADARFNLPAFGAASFTIATLSGNLPFTTVQSFSASAIFTTADTGVYLGSQSTTINSILYSTTFTPDTAPLWTGSLSNSWHIAERTDIAFDFNNGPCGTAVCPDPTVIIHSRNQDTQEYLALSNDGTAGQLRAGDSTAKSGEIKFGRTVTLTEAGGAETVITITTATTESFGLELSYRVHATDATPDYAIREGSLKLVCVNNATVVTCTKDATAQTDDESVLINTSAKTLTYAIATDVATANVAKITFDADSDMAVTAMSITFTAILNGSGTIS